VESIPREEKYHPKISIIYESGFLFLDRVAYVGKILKDLLELSFTMLMSAGFFKENLL